MPRDKRNYIFLYELNLITSTWNYIGGRGAYYPRESDTLGFWGGGWGGGGGVNKEGILRFKNLWSYDCA